jgi:hypothetical protein
LEPALLRSSIEPYAAGISVLLHSAILYWALPLLAQGARPPLWTVGAFALAALALYCAGQPRAKGVSKQALLASIALLHASAAPIHFVALIALACATPTGSWPHDFAWASEKDWSILVLFIWMFQLLVFLVVLFIELLQSLYLLLISVLAVVAFAACVFNVVAYRAFRSGPPG